MAKRTLSYNKLIPHTRFDDLIPGTIFSHANTAWMKLGNLKSDENGKAVDLADGLVGIFYDYTEVLVITTPVTIS